MATIIDGKAFSANLRGEIARKVEILKRDHALTPAWVRCNIQGVNGAGIGWKLLRRQASART